MQIKLCLGTVEFWQEWKDTVIWPWKPEVEKNLPTRPLSLPPQSARLYRESVPITMCSLLYRAHRTTDKAPMGTPQHHLSPSAARWQQEQGWENNCLVSFRLVSTLTDSLSDEASSRRTSPTSKDSLDPKQHKEMYRWLLPTHFYQNLG